MRGCRGLLPWFSFAAVCQLHISGLSVGRSLPAATALVAALALASCAVGPDFLHPAAPEIGRYTKEPLAPVTSSTDAPTGQPQHFLPGPRHSPGVVATVQIAGTDRAGSARAEQQSHTAIGDRDAAGCEPGGLCSRRKVFPACRKQLQSDLPANFGCALSDPLLQRQRLCPPYCTTAGELHSGCLGP